MLLEIGARPAGEGLVALLGACHARIRSFGALALEAAEREAVPDAERREACEAAARYFEQALPLHVADEEHSLAPRLRGRSPELDAALDAMSVEHAQHTPSVAALLEALARVARAPGERGAREALARVVRPLRAELEAHLADEERVLFPAVEALLDDAARAEIVRELRARRA